jgi:8-oxo-dGTP pyrophosphatase MutT (NUDIX family)
VESNVELEPSPAATVVLLRASAAAAELEVLLVRRKSTLAFYGGAWVFPGGRIDAGDGAAGDRELAARTAAARELREETGLQLDPGALVHFAQWITPPGRARRFDTWYFAAPAPRGPVRVDQAEVDAHRWLSPAAALRARAEGQIELPPPTFVTLQQLAALQHPDAALAALRSGPLSRFVPRPCGAQGGTIYLYQGDAGYAASDPQVTGPRHRLIAVGDSWRYERSG